MAINLPRYTEAGVRGANPVAANVIGAQVAAQSQQNLAQNIDKLTSFAFAQLDRQAETMGVEYGVANAPTPEQIRQAQESGDPIPQVGDTFTTFGRAARAGSLFAIERNVETEARQKLAELQATAKLQEFSPEAYQKAADDIIAGYHSSVAEISPKTALAIRASLATVASQQFVTYSNWLLEKKIAREKISTVAGIDTIIQNVDNIVEAGDSVSGPPGAETVVTTDQKLAGERTKILRYSLSVNDPGLASTKLKEFNDKVTAAKISTVARWTQSQEGVPTTAKYNQIMTGKVSDPAIQRMWDSLSPEEKTKAQDEVRRQMKATLELNASVEAEQARQRTQAVQDNRLSFVKAYEKNDAAGMQAALDQMDTLRDADGREKYGAVVSEKRSHTEPGLMLTLEDELTRGKLTNDRVMTLVQTKRLSDTDARSLISKIEVASNREFTESMEYVKRELGFPDRSIINPSAIDRKAIQQVNKITNAMIAARRKADAEGKTFNPFEFAEQQIAEAKKNQTSDLDIARAEQRVRGLAKDMGLPADATIAQIRQELTRRTTLDSKDKAYRNPKTQQDFFDALKLLIDNGSQ